ncbi:MAG: NAD(P)/FAD-dependent oxidoreductase, partial [Verrucomicrobiae bacterium]|nr:NAD(P)/FAD-dependent oxidoreductase [Verrucomicrobiae bacterium]
RRARHELLVDEILYGPKRVANTSGLRLESIGVRLVGRAIRVDAEMRTSVPQIFAAGDVTDELPQVHVAIHQGRVAAHNALRPGKSERFESRHFARAALTQPPVASVGWRESDLKEAGRAYIKAVHPFNDHGAAMVMATREGFVKLLAEPDGKLLGAQAIGPSATDLIHEMVALLQRNACAAEILQVPHVHPSLAEIWEYPAETICSRCAAIPHEEATPVTSSRKRPSSRRRDSRPAAARRTRPSSRGSPARSRASF